MVRYGSPKVVANYLRGQCVAYGYMPGTPEIASCIQREAAANKQSNVARSAARSRHRWILETIEAKGWKELPLAYSDRPVLQLLWLDPVVMLGRRAERR